MPLYGGIDLHANNSVVVVLNEQDEVIYQKRLANDLATILGQLAPYHQKRREAPAFRPGMDRRWARRAQCPRAQQDPCSTRALNGRGNCRGGSPGIHAGEDVPAITAVDILYLGRSRGSHRNLARACRMRITSSIYRETK